MYDVDTDPLFKISDAAEILDCHGIGLFVIGQREDANEAWAQIQAENGDDLIAMAQQVGDQLFISWPADNKPVAWWIRTAFRAVGMRATWEGEIVNPVLVDLTTVHNH